MSLPTLADAAARVNERRKSEGLPTLEEAAARVQQQQASPEQEPPPPTPEEKPSFLQRARGFAGDVASGAEHQGRELFFNLASKLAADDNEALKADIATGREQLAADAPGVDNLGGKVGSFLADEVAMAPVGGVVGRGLRAAKGALTGSRTARHALGELDSARQRVDYSKAALKRARKRATESQGEANRASRRMLGKEIDDPDAWVAERNRWLKGELEAGRVPDLRDAEKFQRNFADDIMANAENAEKFQKLVSSKEARLAKAKGDLVKARVGTAPRRAASGFIGSNVAEGAAKGAAQAAFLADEDNMGEAALYGMLGGGLGPAAVRKVPGAAAAVTVDPAVKLGGRVAAVGADTVNRRLRKRISRNMGLEDWQMVDPKLVNLFSKETINKINSGQLSSKKFVDQAMKKLSPTKDQEGLYAEMLREGYRAAAAQGAVALAEETE